MIQMNLFYPVLVLMCPAGLLPVEVCAKPELRRVLPPNYYLSKKKVVTFSAPTEQDKKRIFELATRPDSFFTLINALNVSWSGLPHGLKTG